MRAAYASGAVQGLAENGLRVDAVYGTSAGGAIAAWFTAGQFHESPRTWAWATDRNLMSYRRWLLRRGPFWDLRLLYEGFYVDRIRLDTDAIRASPYPAYVTAADADTGDTHYLDLRKGNVHRLLMATSALPLAVDEPVPVDGRRLLDGGVTDPIPVARAIADGAKELIVVLNRPHGPPRKPEPAFFSWLVARQYPRLATAARNHHALHNAAVALAEKPPAGVKVTLVRPHAPTGLSRTTRDVALLERAIAQGRADGNRAARERLPPHWFTGPLAPGAAPEPATG